MKYVNSKRKGIQNCPVNCNQAEVKTDILKSSKYKSLKAAFPEVLFKCTLYLPLDLSGKITKTKYPVTNQFEAISSILTFFVMNRKVTKKC